MKKNRISFCTVCMNRIEHLKQTLPKNIEDNIAYGNLEFLLLDYNSKDGLEEWVESEMKEYIDKGILHYYKTTEPEYFHRSHSRNMIIKKATGDIVCNIDADNYTGKLFASYINNQFNEDSNIILGIDVVLQSKHAQAHGKFCAWKKDFLDVTGYDEAMHSYGYEDLDLNNRLELLGRKRFSIDNLFLTYISHGNKERSENEVLTASLEKFLINYIDEFNTEIILLLKNNKFEKFKLKPPENGNSFNVMVMVDGDSFKLGKWHEDGLNISLQYQKDDSAEMLLHTYEANEFFFILQEPQSSINTIKKFNHLTHDHFIDNFMIGFSRIVNLEKYQKNIAANTPAVNKHEIGKGLLYKNFEHKLLLNV